MEYEELEDLLPECPICGGQLTVDDDIAICKDCELHVGYYIANAGAVKLMREWWKY